MPSVTLDLPAEVLAALERNARARGRSLDDEVRQAVCDRAAAVSAEPRRREPGPIFMTEEVSAPFVIPFPPGAGVPVKVTFVQRRDPDLSYLNSLVEEGE